MKGKKDNDLRENYYHIILTIIFFIKIKVFIFQMTNWFLKIFKPKCAKLNEFIYEFRNKIN